MLEEHKEAYRQLGRNDWELNGQPVAVPIYGDAREFYFEGYNAAKRTPRKTYRTRAQQFAELMRDSRIPTFTNPHPVPISRPLKGKPHTRKLDHDDW